jgi:hypothetical protein
VVATAGPKERTMKSIGMVLMLLLVGCNNPLDNSRDVKYKVTSTASTVDITFVNGSGSTVQNNGVEPPWEISFGGDVGDFVYVSAQMMEDGDHSVTVTIYSDGDVFETTTSTGPYAIATASGSLE